MAGIAGAQLANCCHQIAAQTLLDWFIADFQVLFRWAILMKDAYRPAMPPDGFHLAIGPRLTLMV